MEKVSSISGDKKTQQTEVEQNNRKRDHIIFLVCLLLAALFWLLIKLSGDYDVNYNLKVQYHNEPKDKLVTQLIDSTINLSIKADGYKILNLLLSNRLNHLNIDLHRMPPKRFSSGTFAIFTKTLKERLANQWGIAESKINFSTDELRFKMEALDKKVLKVAPRLDLKFKSQHGLYAVNINPQSIVVYGPKTILDTLRNIRTEEISREELASTYFIHAKLENPAAKFLRLSVDKVRLKLDIGKFTESYLVIPIDVTDIHPLIRTFPTTTKVYFNIFLRDYNKIHSNQFKIIPNVKNINLKEVKKLGLKVVRQPKTVNNLRLDPNEVEFIIVNQSSND